MDFCIQNKQKMWEELDMMLKIHQTRAIPLCFTPIPNEPPSNKIFICSLFSAMQYNLKVKIIRRLKSPWNYKVVGSKRILRAVEVSAWYDTDTGCQHPISL